MEELQKVRQAIGEATDPRVAVFRERPVLGLDTDADGDRISRFVDAMQILLLLPLHGTLFYINIAIFFNGATGLQRGIQWCG